MAWAETYEEAVERDAERFWSKVDKGKHPQGCWIWQGVRDKQTGRGQHSVARFRGVAVRDGRPTIQAHIWAYVLTNGSMPAGYGERRGSSGAILDHTCGNAHAGCVNPHHLIASTRGENRRNYRRSGTYEEALEKDTKRFWSKVEKGRHPQGCWIWKGVRNKKTGRGNHSVAKFKGVAVRGGRETVQAHVWSYILTHGSRPLGHGEGRGATGVILAHTCDNGHGGCVNPHHLIASTQADNQRDKWRAGTHGSQLWQKDKLIVQTVMKDLGISRDALFAEVAGELGIQPHEILREAIKIYQSFIAEKFGVTTEFDFNEMAIKIKSRKLQRAGR